MYFDKYIRMYSFVKNREEPYMYKWANGSIVIFFVTFLHGFTPRIGVYVMNVSDESYCLHDHAHDICF